MSADDRQSEDEVSGKARSLANLKGGSRKGIPNKATAAKAAAIAASGLTPLDYLLKVMRDEAEQPDARRDAAKAAAPYVHPKLASVELSGRDGGPIEHAVDVSGLSEAALREIAALPTGGK
jgi:hypothetical protein